MSFQNCQSGSSNWLKMSIFFVRLYNYTTLQKIPKLKNIRSPFLVVMEGDSCSEGSGFESQNHLMDGHFSHLLVVKIVMFI